MAGDWFPLQYWRSRCPEIVRVASMTGRTRHDVLGWVCDFWSWVSTESEDGRVRGVYVQNLPDLIGADAALWLALRSVGWIAEYGGGADGSEGGIVVPNWEIWLCESGKKRRKDAHRKQADRQGGRDNSGKPSRKKRPRNVRETSAKSTPTEQNRREEEKTPLPPAKPGGDSGAYATVPATGEEPDPDRDRSDGWRANAPTPGGPVPPRFDPAAEIVSLAPWVELAEAWTAAALPGAGKLNRTPNRVGLFQQRLADDNWRARWRDAVYRAGRSARCCGLVGTWSLRLDTFLKEPDMLVRILEGEFDDPRPVTDTRLPPSQREQLETMYRNQLATGTITQAEYDERLGGLSNDAD